MSTLNLFGGAVLVLGVGNSMKGDDGIGSYVAALIEDRACGEVPSGANRRVTAIDCGTAPENFTGVVKRVRPEVLVIVDAAEMGLTAGESRIIPSERAGALGLSTHSMPLSLFISYLSDVVNRIVLVGVQPGCMALGATLSDEVKKAGEELAEALERGDLSDLRVLG